MPDPSLPGQRVSPKRTLSLAARVTAFAALFSLALEYGFHDGQLPHVVEFSLPLTLQALAVLVFVAHYAVSLVAAGRVRSFLKRTWLDAVVIVSGITLLLTGFAEGHVSVLKAMVAYVLTVGVLDVSRLGFGVAGRRLSDPRARLRPARVMVTSFVAAILIGGCLLNLPRAMSVEHRHEEGHYLAKRVVNCFFTATSATCVTGLVVYDTGRDFSRFGQIVILVLIQLGGLGIMVFGSLFGMMAGRRLSLRSSLVLQDAMSHQVLGQVSRMVWFVVVLTFVCEAVGAVLLYPMWPESVGPRSERIFYSVFHAISAFCNAGFGLDGQSLIPYRGAWGVYAGIMPLIVLGGLGFPVLHDLTAWAAAWLRRPRPDAAAPVGIPRARPRRSAPRFSLHTRIALVSSAFLIVVPALCLFLLETRDWRRPSQKPAAPVACETTAVMADMGVADRALAALFQSVTARTAGFNSAAVDVNSMSTASHFLLCLLMFVGGSPASAAGGVKTLAAAVLFLAVYSTLRGRQHVEILGRTLPEQAVRRAGVVVVMMGLLVATVVLALCVTERAESTQEILFESVSACGTVGLSTGLTPRLTYGGRIIIMLAMFAGRLGPLTLLMALAGRSVSAPYEYPEESVVIS